MAYIEQYEGGVTYSNSGDILADAKIIIDSSQKAAHMAMQY